MMTARTFECAWFLCLISLLSCMSACCTPSSVSGSVTLLDYPTANYWYTPVGIEFIQNGSVAHREAVLLDHYGNFTTSTIDSGTYDLAFKAAQFVRKVVPSVVVDGPTPIAPVILTNGDADGKNDVTSTDLSIILKNLDLTGDPYPYESFKNATIVVPANPIPSETTAAGELAYHLSKIAGAGLPITVVEGTTTSGPSIVLGTGPTARQLLGAEVDTLGPEEFIIKRIGQTLLIAGGRPRGTMYGVYYLLDEVLGVRWWTPNSTYTPSNPDLSIASLNIRKKPAFDYRDAWCLPGSENELWLARNRTNGMILKWRPDRQSRYIDHMSDTYGASSIVYPEDLFAHTFDRLIPASQYLATNPEYFSLVNGQRVGGQHEGQLCLTNAAVADLMTEKIRAVLAAHPEVTIISITQNDNSNYCRCVNCAAVDQQEGSPSGLMLRFTNDIAGRLETQFANVLFDTFAYTYTRRPPLITRPRQNVVIKLCSIEASFAQPFDHANNTAFVNDLNGWRNIASRIYVWDYTIDFNEPMRPFANLYVQAPNLRILRDRNVKYVLEEGPVWSVGDMSELRGWVLSRFLWDPDKDAKAVIAEFCNGYYGAGGQYIAQYIDLINSTALNSSYYMSVHDMGTAPYMNGETMSQSEELFRSAEAAAAGIPALAKRVRKAHLPLTSQWVLYYDLWVNAATARGLTMPSWIDLVNQFEADSIAHGVYDTVKNIIASGRALATNSGLMTASKEWNRTTAAALAFDGQNLTGWETAEYGPQWIRIDLGQTKNISSIKTYFLRHTSRNVYHIEVSQDGVNWTTIVPDTDSPINRTEHLFNPAVSARYVRTTILSAYLAGNVPFYVGMQEQTIDTQ